MKIRARDSLISGLINGVINGFIAHLHFKHLDSVPMSLNVIAHEQTSVWGQAVSLTFGLGIILSLITSKLFTHQLIKDHPEKQPQLSSSFWSTQLPIALSHAAALLVGLFAFLVTIVVEIRTKRSVIYRKVSIFDK
ncbi:permease [Vibrio mimicus]|uniref:permease n=1 Tax=Vibrio mimicus TaxID=674 RepID=UPI001651F340|nr:permease [Vibrio mimicus]